MELSRVTVEAHAAGATLYICGAIHHATVVSAETRIKLLGHSTIVLRVDLRAVRSIDPDAFARLARAVNEWRDAANRRVTMQFPDRSARGAGVDVTRTLVLHGNGDQRANTGSAVNSAMSWPISTSPG